MKKLCTLFLFLLLSLVGLGQYKAYLGFSGGLGHAASEIELLTFDVDPVGDKTGFANHRNATAFLYHSFPKGIGIYTGVRLISSRYRYRDIHVINEGAFDAFTSRYTFSTKMRYLQLEAAVQKVFRPDEPISFFVRMGGSYSFLSTDPVNEIESQSNLFGTQITYLYLASFPNENTLGFQPEVGLMFGKQKTQWNVSFSYHLGTQETMRAAFSSVSSGDINGAGMISEGDYASLNLGLQFSLFQINKRDATKKKQRLEEREQKQEEKSIAKREQAREKELARLKKENDKKKQDDLKAKEQREKARQDSLAALEDLKLKTDPSGKPKEFMGRSVKEQKSFEVATTTLELEFWDNGKKIDGDSISIYFNGAWIMEDVLLTKGKQSITIEIEPKKKNYLIVYALNEGEHPPNTAAVSFFDGVREQKFSIHSRIDENGAISFRYKP